MEVFLKTSMMLTEEGEESRKNSGLSYKVGSVRYNRCRNSKSYFFKSLITSITRFRYEISVSKNILVIHMDLV